MKDEFNRKACPDAPDYEPEAWSGIMQEANNCYAYAMNDRRIRRASGLPDMSCEEALADSEWMEKMFWPQPGGNAGMDYDEHYSRPAADIFWWAGRDGPLPVPDMTPRPGFYHVALAVALRKGMWSLRDEDYHWWRQDSDGLWSHKPGNAAVLRADYSRNLIHDPRECDRGRYKTFVGFFLVPKGGLKVSVLRGNEGWARWKADWLGPLVPSLW